MGAACGPRLPRLPRAAQSYGGRDRPGSHPPGSLAPAFRRATAVVSRRDRGRDDAALQSDRRCPRHVKDRSRDVQLCVQRRGRRARQRGRERGRGRPRRGSRARGRERHPSIRARRCQRLRQVLQNLVDNAVKFSPSDGAVHVAASTDDGRLRVEISDQGPGVPLEDRRLIFEKFGRSTLGEGKAGQRARPVHRPFDRRGARRLDRRQREVDAWSDVHAALAARIGLRSGRVDARRRARSGAPLPVRRCVRADRPARARPLRPGRRGSLRRAIRGSRPASRRAQSHP